MKHGWGPWTGRVETDRDGIETEYLRRSCQMRHTGGGSVTAADAVPCDAWQQIRVEDVEWKEGRYGPAATELQPCPPTVDG